VVGYPNVFYMLFLMVLLGGLIAAIYVVYRLVTSGKHIAHMPVAYGPAIVLAATIMLVWPDQITAWVYGPK
jgi:hypothetical protein